MTEQASELWRATGSSTRCVDAVWPDGAVVFQPWDGQLLAISYAGVEVWRSLLTEGEASLDALAQRLLGTSDDDEKLQLQHLLLQLSSLNLVTCADN